MRNKYQTGGAIRDRLNESTGLVELVQHFRHKNDTNGNPRRVWVGYNREGRAITAEDEGFSGRPDWALGIPELPNVDCTYGDYRHWVKWGEQDNELRARVRYDN